MSTPPSDPRAQPREPGARPPGNLALVAACGLALLGTLAASPASTYHVNPKWGNDASPGTDPAAPLRTVNRACGLVAAGDTILLDAGVYYENVHLWKQGTAALPITIRGATRQRNVVVLSGADPRFRQGTVPWSLQDPALGLYSAPLAWLPSRVLANDVDLYPYESLKGLRTFVTANGAPGPRHGYFQDAPAGLIYVRLNAKYGSLDPNAHSFAIGPVNGGGPSGKVIAHPTDYLLCLHQPGSANVVVDGITFETPGVVGVFTKAGNVTVQNCYFFGCRSAICGNGPPTDPVMATNDVTLQYCEYSEFPTFSDAADTAFAVYADPKTYAALPPFYWWQRKTLAYSYEFGCVLNVGFRWKVLHNYLHDCVDAVSGWGLPLAADLEVAGNVISSCIDNGFEVKTHEQNVRVHDNFFIDCFEAINYQPYSGLPWPSGIFVDHNVITETAAYTKFWQILPWERGAFKLYVDGSNWSAPGMAGVPTSPVTPGGAGFVASNNTVLQADGNAFTLGAFLTSKLTNVHFINNLFESRYAFSNDYRESLSFDFSGFDCQGNATVPAIDNLPGPGARVAGAGGQCVPLPSQLGFRDPAGFDYALSPGSPLLGGGVAAFGGQASGLSPDVGAFARGVPGTLPLAGVQPD